MFNNDLFQDTNKFKEVMDFKVRALDFISIYVKQKGYASEEGRQLHLIQGLLKALTTAHKDRHTILFDRIKTVLAMMAKQDKGETNGRLFMKF